MVNFLSPVIPHPHVNEDNSSLRMCDRYFTPLNFSGRSFKILSHDPENQVTAVENVESENEDILYTSMKILSCFTIIVPVLALIGKVIYRCTNHFIDQKYVHARDQIAQELNNLDAEIARLKHEEEAAKLRTQVINDEIQQIESQRQISQLQETVSTINNTCNKQAARIGELIIKNRNLLANANNRENTLTRENEQFNNKNQQIEFELLNRNSRLAYYISMIKQQNLIEKGKNRDIKQLTKALQSVKQELDLEKTRFNQALDQSKLTIDKFNDLLSAQNSEINDLKEKLRQKELKTALSRATTGSSTPTPDSNNNAFLTGVLSSNSLNQDASRAPTPPEEKDYVNVTNTNMKNQSLDKYLEKHCPGFKKEAVINLAQEGAVWMRRILSGELTAKKFVKERGNIDLLFTRIIWFSMLKAREKKQMFYEGTFILDDPEGRLIDFINSDVLKFNYETGKGFYARWSSHMKGVSQDCDHRGLNIKENPMNMGIVCTSNYALPANKSTILFIPLISGKHGKRLFIKPENHGLSFNSPAEILESYQHMIDYCNKAFWRYWDPVADHDIGMQKERIPSEAVASFLKVVDKYFEELLKEVNTGKMEILKGFLDSNKAILQQLKLLRFWGEIWDLLPQTPQDPSSNVNFAKEKFKSLLDSYRKSLKVDLLGCQMINSFVVANCMETDVLPILESYHAALDNQDKRFWNEVILTLNDLMTPCDFKETTPLD